MSSTDDEPTGTTATSGGTSLDELIPAALQHLRQAGVPSPRADLELLLAHVLGIGRGEAAAAIAAGRLISEAQAQRWHGLVAERGRRIPLQHLTGLAPFRSLQLRVGPGVFIPRPETEQVAQVVLDHLARRRTARSSAARPLRVIDLGTGSGALAAAIAAETPGIEVHAVEVSEQAAAWAQLNLEPLGVTLHRMDLRELPDQWRGSFDVVVSNPPYIPPRMVPQDPEVRDHDPQLALYGGGEDGLELPRAVVGAARELLTPGGWFILEHAEVQAEAIAAYMRRFPDLVDVRTHQDLTGRDRAVSAHLDTGLDTGLNTGLSTGLDTRPATQPDAGPSTRPSACASAPTMGE